MASDNNIEIIESNLTEILASTSPMDARQKLLNLSKNIDNYLNRLDSFYNSSSLGDASSIVSQYQAMQASQPTVTYAIYKRLSYSESEIQSLLKQGYIILEKIRTFFTAEEIKYEIGFIKGGKLFEFQLTLQEVLERTKVAFNTRAKIDNIFKLRMSGGKKSLLNIYQDAQKAITADVKDSSTVFSAIYDYVKKQNSHGVKINKGNAYEAYKRIVAERSNQIPPPVSVDLIQQTLTEIRGNTASSVKGGDFLTSQIKFYSAAPSLVTTSLIRTSLRDISNSFKMLSDSNLDQDFKDAIQKIFIKSDHQAAEGADREGARQAEEYLTNLLKALGFKVS